MSFWGINELTCIKCWEQCLAHSESSVKVGINVMTVPIKPCELLGFLWLMFFSYLLCMSLFHLSSSKSSLWSPIGFVCCLLSLSLSFKSGWLWIIFFNFIFWRNAQSIEEWSSIIILHHGSQDHNPFLWTFGNLLIWCMKYTDLNILIYLFIHYLFSKQNWDGCQDEKYKS